jgi:hypothetical protein
MEIIKRCSINWATSESVLLLDACLSTSLEIANYTPFKENLFYLKEYQKPLAQSN